ncbi:MAG: ribosome-associated translation inhibitor RaiA [Acidimicrobiales bacterium]|nr:ribosome-associated translation inhibitor RaiA [Acidimicrobiales bacterium]
MEVTVSARHTEVPERLRVATEEKVARLARYLDGLDHAEVHFSTLGNPRIADAEQCEITIEGHGHFVRAKVTASDAAVAVDKAVAKLEQQLKKLKTKLQRQRQGGGKGARRAAVPAAEVRLPDASTPPAGDGDGDGERLPRIVKVKQFATIPMTADDAAQRMDLLGHGFFFFTNLDTGRAAVVYRRDDGDIGLIDADR